VLNLYSHEQEVDFANDNVLQMVPEITSVLTTALILLMFVQLCVAIVCKYGRLYLVASAIAVLRVQLRFVDCINKRKKKKLSATLQIRDIKVSFYNHRNISYHGCHSCCQHNGVENTAITSIVTAVTT